MSFYVLTATFFLLPCHEWDRVVALPRHKFVTGATLLQLRKAFAAKMESSFYHIRRTKKNHFYIWHLFDNEFSCTNVFF